MAQLFGKFLKKKSIYPQHILFMHIPKTAGTALRDAITNAAPPNYERVFEYGPRQPLTTQKYLHLMKPKNKLAHADQNMASVFQNKHLLLAGHFKAQKYQPFFKDEYFITFLRHPLKRLLSHYNHARSHQNETGSLKEFIKRKYLINLQSQFVQNLNLDKVGFIGLTEHLDEDLPKLAQYLGFEIPMITKNVGHYKTKPDDMIDSETLALFNELNQDDIKLYNSVLAARC